MKRQLTRRAFIALVGFSAGLLLSGKPASGSNLVDDYGSQKVVFSPDIAFYIALNFANSICPAINLQLQGNDPIPIFNTEGDLVGYEIDFSKDDISLGYVELNINAKNLIASYSFVENSNTPFSYLSSKNDSLYSESVPRCLIEESPFSFKLAHSGVANDTFAQFRIDGKDSSAFNLYSKGDSNWWGDVLISENDVFSGTYYAGNEVFIGDLFPISEELAMKKCGLYACGPHALYVVGSTIPNDGKTSTLIPNPIDDFEYYKKLWEYSNTQVIGTGKYGSKLGETSSGMLGPAFVRLGSELNTQLKYRFVDNPSFLQTVSHLNSHKICIVGCGINQNGKQVGHFMAVNGYCYLKNNSTNRIIQSIHVWTGWNAFAYFNFDFSRYAFKNMTFLHHNV